jgi:hypothetical protein
MGSSPKDLPWELRVNAKNGEMNREKYGTVGFYQSEL